MKPMTDKKALWWEEQRADGKTYWIAKTAALWGLLVFSFSNLFAWLIGAETTLSLLTLFFYIGGGALVGVSGWLGNEKHYRGYLLKNGRIKELNP